MGFSAGVCPWEAAEGAGAGCGPSLGWPLSLFGLIHAPEVVESELLFQEFKWDRGSKASAPGSQPCCRCRKRMTIAQSLEHPWIKVRS